MVLRNAAAAKVLLTALQIEKLRMETSPRFVITDGGGESVRVEPLNYFSTITGGGKVGDWAVPGWIREKLRVLTSMSYGYLRGAEYLDTADENVSEMIEWLRTLHQELARLDNEIDA
jgi:hypothetical protein